MYMNKSTLRKEILKNRLLINDADRIQAQHNIIKQLLEEEHFLKATFVGIFYPTKNEIDLSELITMFPDKIFAYPKVVNERIMYLQLDKHTTFFQTKFGVNEPKYGFDITAKLEVILVPALGMTKSNYRLGYGKGFFDKFFKIYPNAYKIGIIYETEVIEFSPLSYDVALDTYIKG